MIVVLSIFSVFKLIFKILFRSPFSSSYNRRSSGDGGHHNTGSHQSESAAKNQKVFGKDEGEYIDFEEVKD